MKGLINRDFQNLRFSNWRLGRNDFVRAKWGRSLDGGELDVADTQSNVGYLHTRASVMRNHLLHSAGRWFLFVREGAGPQGQTDGAKASLALFQLVPQSSSSSSSDAGSNGECLVRVAGLSPPSAPPSSLADTRLDSSIAVFNATSNEGDYDAVVSLGLGDARVLLVRNFSATWVTDTQFPLRATPPLIATRPFSIEAAYLAPSGQLRVVAWSTRPKAGPRAAACEVYALSLAMPQQQQEQQQQQEASAGSASYPSTQPTQPISAPPVEAVQLLARSVLPPHVVLPNPRADSVALGLDPSGWESAGMAGKLGTDAQDQQQLQPPQQGGGVAFCAPPTTAPAGGEEEAVEHVECRRGKRGADEMEEDDEGDMDPRTLAQAAARLAKYTSEAEAGALPEQQWADLYNEGGALDVGEGAEGAAPCDFVVAPVQRRVQELPQPSQPPQDGEGLEDWHVSCGPHKVLTNDVPGAVAVSDDVDACVLQLSWPEQDPVPTVRHVHTVPALAYIAAGKTQRKHLLTGMPGRAGAGIAAVLVEATKFYYVYGWVKTGDEYGVQQVVDMELQEGERVMGARLVPGFTMPGSQKPHVLLVLATSRRLVMHALSGMD